jgi:hypothetical protein
MKMKLRLTSMGMLEALMWSAGGCALLIFWLLWPDLPGKPEAKRAAAERRIATAGLFSASRDAEPDSPALREWRERFHSATVLGRPGAGHKERSESDWPATTGSGPARSASVLLPEKHPTAVAKANAVAPTVFSTVTASDLQDRDTDKPADTDAGIAASNAHEHGPVNGDAEKADTPEGALGAAVEPTSGELASDRKLAESGVNEGIHHTEAAQEAILDGRSVITDAQQRPDTAMNESIYSTDPTFIGAASEAESSRPNDVPGPGQEVPAYQFASLAAAVPEPERIPGDLSELLRVTVPEVGLVLIDAPRPAVQEQAHTTAQTIIASPSSHAPAPGQRDVLIEKGEERLERGDISGARLFFSRAAASGDPRAAIGMARTYDPEVLRALRVYGVRPDPAQAAHWYGRSKTLHAIVSTR